MMKKKLEIYQARQRIRDTPKPGIKANQAQTEENKNIYSNKNQSLTP